MDIGLLLLRVVHIASGAFWVGAAFAFVLFVVPSANALEPPATKAFMDQIIKKRRYSDIIFASTVFTVAAGALLYWRDSNGFRAEWITSPTGIGFTIGALAAIVSFLIGPLALLPRIKRLQALGDTLEREHRPPTPEEGAEFGRLNAGLRTWGAIDLVGLSIAVVMMATARYLG